MKLQIDTTKKTIKVDESVKLKELSESLEKLLPNGEWKEYILIIEPFINWISAPPIITYPWVNPASPSQPFYKYPEITCGTGVYTINL